VLPSSLDHVAPTAPLVAAHPDINPDDLLHLVAKTMLYGGELSGTELAGRLGVRFAVLDESVELLKRERLCEISGGGISGPASYRYRLTESGRKRAALYTEQNHYVGKVPVSIDEYRRYMRRFVAEDRTTVTHDAVRLAFSHLVLSERVLDQLGPAVSARHSLFIYGAPGNGKTVIATAIRNLLDGEIAIPYALNIDGHIVRVYDPVNHEAVASGADGALEDRERLDGRWVRCRRPMIMAGGELTLSALELGASDKGVARMPLQGLANGGVLVIDDFGRQQVAPRDLLNRWIVPLESRVDFLTLQSGQKVELPFNVLVIFATNIKPAELVDEAFLRRIHYKVFAESPTVAEFMRIFENCCKERDLTFDRALVEHLLQGYYAPRKIALRGCQPRDLIDQVLSLAEYRGEPRRLTGELLEAACAGYFVDERESPVVYV